MRNALTGLLLLVTLLAGAQAATDQSVPDRKPNVIVILTDDQGYGDLSSHGNPVLKTPQLDRLRSQSVRFTDFHVAPICTPTRSQIMTGRDSLANGAYCVCSGHEFIRPGIPTMAEIFAAAGYRTALFGKWHLGDNYPYRPQDRGFQETLTFEGYGMGSTSSYWNCDYMDPWLLRNGRMEQVQGYCTDIFFAETLKWIKARADKHEPFFVYLPTNAPHYPLQVPPAYAKPYLKLGKNVSRFFGMIANIDENLGRLDAFLKEAGLSENTIVIFMTDNGGTIGVPVSNARMKGTKGTYYDGGHRVPCFVRWPAGGLRKPGDIATVAQAQDLLPTLIDLCGLPRPRDAVFDGQSLAPLLRGEESEALTKRMIVVQCALWDEYQGPNKWAGTVLWDKWRLVKGQELYDIGSDPGQKKNLAAQNPQIVAAMREHYEQWWKKTEPLAREFQPIHLGSDREPTTILTSHNWVERNTADQTGIRNGIKRNGPWHVLVEQGGEYEITLRRWPAEADLPITAPSPAYKGKLEDYPAGKALPIASARLKIAAVDESKPVKAEEKAVAFRATLPAGRTTLQTWFIDAQGKELCGAYYVSVRRVK